MTSRRVWCDGGALMPKHVSIPIGIEVPLTCQRCEEHMTGPLTCQRCEEHMTVGEGLEISNRGCSRLVT